MPKNNKVKLCKKHGWNLYYKFTSPANNIYKFKKSNCFLSIYQKSKHGSMEVMTALKHPIKGETSLFREIQTLGDLEKILLNPREHMHKKHRLKTGFCLGKYYKTGGGNDS